MLRSVLQGRELFLLLLFGAAMAGAAAGISDPYLQLILGTIPIWAALALSWNLFSGYTGLISFGHATFFGLGAFTVALLAIHLQLPAGAGLAAAAVVGALAAALIGLVTFRLRGHYFALAMLAYPMLFIFLFDWMGWQELSLPVRRGEPWLFLQFSDPRVTTVLAVGLMTAIALLTLFVERSHFGLAMLSIKQNEAAAETAGIRTLRVKMMAFVASGALCALAGGFHAVVLQIVTPHGVLGTVVSAQALILALFGGVGTLWGPLVGAIVLVPLTETRRAQLGHVLPGIQGVIYGVTIMAVIMLAPEGVVWKVRDLLARRRAASAPSATLLISSAAATATVHPVTKVAPRTLITDVILQVQGLSKSFGGLKAAQDVSFEVRRGEILGIIGPNGAGKTTLFNLLGGLIEPTAGEVTFKGQSIGGLATSSRCALGIARTVQVARPFPRMDVLHNVVVGAIAGSQSSAAALARAHEALALVGLQARAAAPVLGLTNRELRLMELARALASGPRLLLLDETLAGLGAVEVETMLRVIQRLPDAGITVVIIERTMHAMTRLADRFVVLDHGQLIAEGEPAAVMRNPAVIDAYRGKKWAQMHARHPHAAT